MIGAGWRDRIGPPSILLGSALILTAAIPAATAVVSRPSPGPVAACPGSPAKAARAAQRDGVQAKDVGVRAEARITSRGELTGRILRLDQSDEPAISISLPAESFVSERTGDAVVYTRSGDGSGSEVHIVNVETGCDTIVASPAQIVRSAILDRSGSAVYVHSVTRAGRGDAGVERHDLSSGAVTTAVPPLAPSAVTGRIFATELRWSTDGRALTVQSCGFASCLSRVLDVASGVVATIDGRGQGALIATTSHHLVAFAPCPGLPCSVIAFDIESGAGELIAEDALDARIDTRSDGGNVLYITTADGKLEVGL
jgi:hypothetical protein